MTAPPRAALGPRVIVALDRPDRDSALRLAQQLPPDGCRLKVGYELFTACGPAMVEDLQALGFEVFLDLKYHDIPNTVAGACAAAARLGVWMLNVHAGGGRRMLEAAAEAVSQAGTGGRRPPLLIAVTVLTSLAQEDLADIGLPGSPGERAGSWARLSADCGLDGVVCSAHEAAGIRERCGDAFLRVTPGVRPAGAGRQDQRRTMTPGEAMAAGASCLVIGRPVTGAPDPAAALLAIRRELGEGG